jgi:hypothetical protein
MDLLSSILAMGVVFGM